MYKQLTSDHSIFIIDRQLVGRFIQHIDQFEDKNALIKINKFDELDCWAVLFNIWLNGERAAHYRIIKPEIELYYSADSALIKMINQNVLYNKFIENANAKQRCIFSIYLGNEILKWALPLVKELRWHTYKFEQISYYSIYKKVPAEQHRQFLIGHAILIKKIIQHFGKEQNLNRLILESVKASKTCQINM